MTLKLFAVFLGGTAAKANTELHDVVFAVGDTIEATYEQLMDKWFGTPVGLHLDSYLELDIVDGYKISLTTERPTKRHKLFFINLGAYSEGVFAELHANKFLVCETLSEAKVRGRQELLQNWSSAVHKDNLFEVDEGLEISKIGCHFVTLEPTDQPELLAPINGYHIIPKVIVQEYIARQRMKVSQHL